MDKLTARGILAENIEKNLLHQDYDHVVNLAIHYRRLITGKDIKPLLKRFNPRESEALFEQRVNLTILTSPAVSHSVMKPFYKVPRATPISAKIKAKNTAADPEAIEKVMEEKFKDFYGNEQNIPGVDYFLQTRFMELTFIDPNAWVVIEWDPFDSNKEKATPRPLEVSSSMAKNYLVRNNRLEWLRIEQPVTMKSREGKTEAGVKHTLYAAETHVEFIQTLLKSSEVALTNDQEYVEINGKFYIVTYYDNALPKAPAFRIGYDRDIETNGRTFVNPFHPALCHFDKSVKQISEYDLSTTLHTFPQKIVRLVKTCPGVPSDPNGLCMGGKLPDGQTCPSCEGTGKAIHTSGQDIVEVELPENIREDGFIPLSEMVYYVPLPVELLKMQREWMKELAFDVHQTVFNTTALVKKDSVVSGEKTAFEVDNDMQSVYDAISSFSDKYSAVWMTIVEFIAIVTDNADKVNYIHRLPSDLKLKTKNRLYAEYDIATKSAMPSFIVDSITDELAESVFMDDAEKLLEYRIKKQYFPFRGKTKDEVMFLLNADNVLAETKILYNYFEDIFSELIEEYKKKGTDFFLQTGETRKKVIDEKVDAIKVKLDAAKPKAGAFGDPRFNPEGDPNNPE